MDFNSLIGALTLLVSTLQFKLDHFKNRDATQRLSGRDVIRLGEAIRALESALSETVAAATLHNLTPNRRLSRCWEDASEALRQIPGCEGIAGLTFEKSLFWRNPEIAERMLGDRVHEISLKNILVLTRKLRTDFDKVLSRAA